MAIQFDEGRYWVKVLSQALGKSKKKGTPEFALRVLVMGRVNPEQPDGDLLPCNKAERTIYLYITEGTAEYVIRDLERIGFDKPSFKFLDPNNEHFHDFAGSEFEAFCDHEEYEGKQNEKWRFAKPRGQSDVAPLEASEVRKLDSLFGKQLSKVGKKNGSPPKAEKPAASAAIEDRPPPPTDDDIPF
jgi:hypothetical protein